MLADVIVHPAIDECDARDRARIGERMPRPPECDRIGSERRAIFLQAAVDEQKPKRLIDIGARGRHVAVRRLAAAIARDDVAVVEDGLAAAEDEIDVAPDFALGEVRATGVWKKACPDSR